MKFAMLFAAASVAGMGIGHAVGHTLNHPTSSGFSGLAAPSLGPQAGNSGGPGTSGSKAGTKGIKSPKRLFTTFVTGEAPGADVVFRVSFDPSEELSGSVDIAIIEGRAIPIDGIDFVPGTRRKEVYCGSPSTLIAHYDLPSGATLPDLVPDTDLIAVPPLTAGTWPSSVLTTSSHTYYIENQFGFGSTTSHRIIRKPLGGGPEEVVYDGAADGLINFEGLEIVASRLYFFCADPLSISTRALMSIGLSAGVSDGAPAMLEIPGLFQDPFDTDGSDEIDFDPVTGLLYGTNIENGEIIAYDPIFGVEFVSPGSTHFIDGAEIAASVGDLSLLSFATDGIRSTGEGHLVVTGKGGVILSIDIFGVMADGADDADIIPLVFAPGLFSFDDLTPLF